MTHVGTDQAYTLLSFEEECCISVVPSKKVQTDNGLPPKKGDIVSVLWEGKKLCATFLMTGVVLLMLIYYYT